MHPPSRRTIRTTAARIIIVDGEQRILTTSRVSTTSLPPIAQQSKDRTTKPATTHKMQSQRNKNITQGSLKTLANSITITISHKSIDMKIINQRSHSPIMNLMSSMTMVTSQDTHIHSIIMIHHQKTSTGKNHIIKMTTLQNTLQRREEPNNTVKLTVLAVEARRENLKRVHQAPRHKLNPARIIPFSSKTKPDQYVSFQAQTHAFGETTCATCVKMI